MPWDMNDPAHFARACMVLAAWQAGELSEEQAGLLLAVDAVSLRLMLAGAVGGALAAWAKYREAHPAGA
jgi:hypothetical protein